ncbi:MAG: tellurite resistance TerB family protein [Limnobacter sp.]|nr:tellurite resistance TerB family protein [Limnobacter sp.]
MNSKGLLDQLLRAGQDMLQGAQVPTKTTERGQQGSTLGGMQVKDLLVGAGGGAAATAALGMLLGGGRQKKIAKKALTYGGLAAIGVLAYKAYGNYQEQNRKPGAPAPAAPQTVDRLPPAQVEQHSQAILRALIAAAKADGHIDTTERQLIDAEISKLGYDPDMRQWFERELNKPLDPAEIASYAVTPEMASEMFLASVLVVDEESFMERSYLQELARQLRIDPALEIELRLQVEQARSATL